MKVRVYLVTYANDPYGPRSYVGQLKTAYNVVKVLQEQGVLERGPKVRHTRALYDLMGGLLDEAGSSMHISGGAEIERLR